MNFKTVAEVPEGRAERARVEVASPAAFCENRRMETELDPRYVRDLARTALAEDRADRDITTEALVPSDQAGRAELIAKEQGVLAGLAFAAETFAAVDPKLRWSEEAADGARISPGQVVGRVEGSLASILRGERVALNFVSHLSGVATAANDVVRLLEGTGCRLRDTRKTTPGLRAAEKYATRMGGAANHRFNLADGVLIKDNHIAALRERDLGVGDAVRLARAANPGVRIECEVTSLAEAREAAGADELLLDNMTPDEVREVVLALGPKRPALEASGGITAANARAYAEAGVDYISMGAITHSARALDMSLEVEAG
jgi:nicotinate-nucleotide pyrophosphorylase (carboxylating)